MKYYLIHVNERTMDIKDIQINQIYPFSELYQKLVLQSPARISREHVRNWFLNAKHGDQLVLNGYRVMAIDPKQQVMELL